MGGGRKQCGQVGRAGEDSKREASGGLRLSEVLATSQEVYMLLSQKNEESDFDLGGDRFSEW
jgi:hypothetical protein